MWHPGAGLMWGALCHKRDRSASADVEMASGTGSSLLEAADAPGEGQLWLEWESGVMSNLSPLRKSGKSQLTSLLVNSPSCS